MRALGSAEAVDSDTLFQIGSTTKAFTSAALAILVEEGRLGWDDRVIDHLPDFRMYDPWVTREITVRDLLVHRSGLGRGQGDLLFVPSNAISRADMVRRIRFMKPATSFRAALRCSTAIIAAATTPTPGGSRRRCSARCSTRSTRIYHDDQGPEALRRHGRGRSLFAVRRARAHRGRAQADAGVAPS